MVVMHSVINQREKYGSFGWTQPYFFSPSDIKLSLFVLSDLCTNLEPNGEIPIELLQYSTAQLAYGGIVTNFEDKQTLNELVNTFIHSRVYTPTDQGVANQRKAKDQKEKLKQLYDLTGLQTEGTSVNTQTGLAGFIIKENGKEKSYFTLTC